MVAMLPASGQRARLKGRHGMIGWIGPDNHTSCGPSTANGDVYGDKFYFFDDTNVWEAGFGSHKGANCIGITISSWHLSRWYSSLAAPSVPRRLVRRNHDNYALAVKGFLWGGVVHGLT